MGHRGLSVNGVLAAAKALTFVALGALFMPAQAQQAVGQVELLKDIQPGVSSASSLNVIDIAAGGDLLYLSTVGNEPLYGYELHSFDPQQNVLTRLNDLYDGSNGSHPQELTWLDGKLYFRAQARGTGSELFSYDSSTGETQLVVDIMPDVNQSSSPQSLTIFDGKLYFIATTPVTFRRDVYVYDPAQTSPSAQNLTNYETDNASKLANAGDRLWVAGNSNANVMFLQHLYTSGSSFETLSLTTVQPGLSSISFGGEIVASGSRLFLTTSTNTYGHEPMVVDFDSSFSGYGIVLDQRGGSGSSSPNNLTMVNDAVYWNSYNGTQWDLLKFTSAVEVITSHANYSAQGFTTIGSSIYMSRGTSETGQEPWILNTSTDELLPLADMVAGVNGSFPEHFTEFNGTVYFNAYTPTIGRELYVYDPQVSQLDLVADLAQFALSSFPTIAAIADDYSAIRANVAGQYITADPEQPQLEQLSDLSAMQPIYLTQPPVPPTPVFNEVISVDDATNEVIENTEQVMLLNHSNNSLQQISAFTAISEQQQTRTQGIVRRDNQVIYNSIVNGAVGYKLHSYDLGTGATTELFASTEETSYQMFGTDGFIFYNTYNSLNLWRPYVIDMQGQVVALNDLTSGLDIGYTWEVHHFNNKYYMQSYDTATQYYWWYVFDPLTMTIERAASAEDFGGSANDLYIWAHVLYTGSSYMIVSTQTQSGQPGLYQFDSNGTVTELTALSGQYIYAAIEYQGKLVVRTNNGGIGVYDYTEQTLVDADSSAFTNFFHAGADFYEIDGRLVYAAGSEESGYNELFTLNLADMRVELLAELNPGARNSELVIMGISGSKLILRGNTDAHGYELFSYTFNNAPVISGTPATTVAQGAIYEFTPTGSDADNEPFSYVIENKPSWASFSESSGALTGTPGNGDVGTHSNIIIGITDGKATTKLDPFTITVTNVNDAPTISGAPTTLSVLQDQVWSFTPSIADIDVGDQLTLSLNAGAPAWLSINAGTISGTPGNSDVGVSGSIVVTVTDTAGASASLPGFTITVVNVNDAPIIGLVPITTINQGELYFVEVGADDQDLGDVVTFSSINKPEWLDLNAQTGVLTGTPSNDDVGVYRDITIRVSDLAGATASAPPFDITVLNVNDAPTITGTPDLRVDQDQPYYFKPTANDIDVGAQLTFSLSPAAPSWLSFDTGSGILSGTPGNDDVGSYGPFTLSVSDGELSAALPAFTITVDNVNDAPGIFGTPVTSVNQDAVYLFEPTGDDMDVGDKLTGFIEGKPEWATFDPTTGILTGTPRNADVGVYENIVIGVRDLAGATASLPAFSITVVNVNDAPMITNTPQLTLLDGQAYSFVPEIADPDLAVDPDESFTFTEENVPAWLTFNPADGSLTGTPARDDVGEWAAISITVTDNDGLSDSVGPFTIVVESSNTAPVAVDDAFSFASNQFAVSQRLDVLANDDDADGDVLDIVYADVINGGGGIDVRVVKDAAGVGTSIETFAGQGNFVGTIVLSYTIRDAAGEDDTAQVSLVFSAPSNAITLTPPADVTLLAEGPAVAIYQSDLGTATATLSDGTPVPVSVSGLQSGATFTSGVHTFTWSAGSGSNQVSKPQTVRVIPTVSLHRGFRVDNGVAVEVPVTLSGPAPSYPYVVNLVVNDAPTTVTFTDGATQATLSLPALEVGREYLEISIAATENIGKSGAILVTQGRPVPPVQVIGNLGRTTALAGEQLTMTVPSRSDLPVVTADMTFTGLFYSPGQNFATKPMDLSFVSATEFTVVIPADAVPGFHQIAAINIDTGTEIYQITALIMVRAGRLPGSDDSIMAFEYNPEDEDLSRDLDQNDNGFSDYHDGRGDLNSNGIPAYLDRALTANDIWADGVYAHTQPGLHIGAYPTLNDTASIRVTATPDAVQGIQSFNAFTQAGLDISSYRFYGEFYQFYVTQFQAIGDQVEVVLPLDEPLAAGAEFLLWQDGAWRAFAEGAGGALYSAGSVLGECPTVGSAAWQPGLNEGHWCVQLLVTDGGANDTDGAADGFIEVFGGVAIDSSGNAAPVAVADTAVAVWRGSASLLPLANDTDADGDSLSIVSASADIGTVTVNAARTGIQFVSPGDFAGVATITYVVTDNNGGVAVGTATVTVLENRMPVLGADSAATVSGRPVSVNVLANDADPDGDVLSLTGASVSSGSGTVSYSGSTVNFTPAVSFVGVATVSYSVSDGRGGSATGTLTVQVRQPVEVIEVRPATGSFWWFITLGGLLLAFRRRSLRYGNC